MKKVGILIAAVMIACILLAGMFSTGLIVGNLLLPQKSEAVQSYAKLPVIPETGLIAPTSTETDLKEPESNDPESNVLEESPTATVPSTEIPEPAVGLNDLFVPFWETWDIVHQYYVNQPIDDDAMMQGAIQGMITVMDTTSSTLVVEIPGIEDTIKEGGTPDDLQELFTPFWTNWMLLHAVDNQLLVQGAISGMLDSLGDPHTSYINPQDYLEATMIREGEESYEGIGAWVDVSRDYLTIVTPFPGSPAEKAGLQPGDKILAVNGEDMTGIDGELVRQKIIGPAGTTITLSILREGMKPFDVEVTRGSIIVPSVESRMLDDNIAYIRLYTFGDKSPDEIREALKRLLADDPVGLIFDLRYNPGGTVDSAVAIASEFVNQGVIFYEVYGDGTEDIYDSQDGGLATDIPLVVLVNEGSASASEIVSGAIQDYGRAPLVGTTTFGKGSVQYWIPLSKEQGAVRVTIASWLTPNHRLIHEIGLEPDFPIIGIPQSIIDEGFDPSVLGMDPEDIIILSPEEIQQGRDVQLEKAIEILLADEN
jgi:carboxyl-terminal processing protease